MSPTFIKNPARQTSSVAILLLCTLIVAITCFKPSCAVAETKGTIRYVQSDSFGANYVADNIIIRGFNSLGYDVSRVTMSTLLAFQAVAQGDIDLGGAVNFPQSDGYFETVKSQVVKLGDGEITGGGINGYLIDKKTAEKYNIRNLEQLGDPKIAGLFGSSGKAELIDCDPGWSCARVVEYQMKRLGLDKTVHLVSGKYELLVANALARFKSGNPILLYAWSPSWVTSDLVPGRDVVWLPATQDIQPPFFKSHASPLVPDVQGCAGGISPCRMSMAPWNYMPVVNREFAGKNPTAMAFLREVKIPRADWSTWEAQMSNTAGGKDRVKKLGDDWIATHQSEFQSWIAAARTTSAR